MVCSKEKMGFISFIARAASIQCNGFTSPVVIQRLKTINATRTRSVAMNNDAFQNLVRERSNVKSSKEIAREAVQEEFRKRRGRQQQQQQRRGGGGGGSEDDDDVGSSDEEGGGRRQQKRQLDKRSKSNRNDEEDDKQKDNKDAYRDRAKERRETSAGITQNKEGVVVKGLDLNLARSVKKQTYVRGTDFRKEEAAFVQSRQEALQFISSASSSSTTTTAPFKSELGKEMLEYLRSTFLKDCSDKTKTISVTPAGTAIQQSVLTFSILANPGDTARAWEVPREQTYASIDCRRLYEKATPCCSNLLVLESMEKALTRNRHDQKKAVVKKTKPRQKDEDDSDDDDDDIFGDVGEYDPISDINNPDDKNAHDDKRARPKVDKGSLFEQEDDSSKDAKVAVGASVSETASGVEGEENAAPTITRLVGLSSSSFSAAGGTAAGYGDDEMDVDFDGRIQDEEEEEAEGKQKKKKKKKRKRKKGSGSDED
jgi:hypothetical protein